MIFVMMGVTGSGKTTIGQLLAKRLGVRFADGDDYHPAANKAKLAAGIPLTDEDRMPWLGELNRLLRDWRGDGDGGVLACSALKQSYRAVLEDGLPAEMLQFVLLEASPALLAQRLAGRHEHFMNPALLGSQLKTLEDPGDTAVHVTNDGTPDQTVDAILTRFGIKAPAAQDGERV